MDSNSNLPIFVMIFLQCIYASITLVSRAAFAQEMNPRLFVVYRQTIATLLIAPIAIATRKKTSSPCRMEWKSFGLIFLAALVGVTMQQNFYFEGLYLVSSSITSAMLNLVPAVTFVIAYFLGMEKVNIRDFRSMCKVLGTVICVIGAFAMAMLKGPKLLNMELIIPKNSLIFTHGNDGMWLIGCLLLFASSCSWSLWLILQVPISASYPDHLSLTAWLCFMAAMQSAVVTFFFEPDLNAWKLHSYFDLISCAYTAVGSVISIFGQAWCISRKGPLFSAMFNPLNTVIVTILASFLLKEKLFLGGLLGAVGVIFGLYMVLWGKAKDLEVLDDQNTKGKRVKDEATNQSSSDMTSCSNDLEQPLLLHDSAKQ